MNNLIKKLTESYGPSGNEEEIRELIKAEVAGHVDEISTDVSGNLLAIKRGTGPRIMLAAHMDEIGIIVTHVDDKGFLRFNRVGGVHPETLIGQRVRFARDKREDRALEGVIGAEPRGSSGEAIKLDKLYIDIGAKSKEEAEAMAGVGSFATFWRQFSEINGRWVAKAMDDRIGCAVLVQLLRELETSANELFCVFTVQEEIGTRGAVSSAYQANPRLAVAVDVTLTGDTPESKPMAISLGKGPGIKVKDGGMIANPRVRDLLIDAAEASNTAYQMEVLEGGTTDAMAIQTSRSGVPTGALSIPCRYVHTPSEMVDPADVLGAVKLLRQFVTSPLQDI